MHIILYSNNKVYSSFAEISKKVHQDFFHFIGAPDRSRTCNRQNRNLILYPIELRAHISFPIIAQQRMLCHKQFKAFPP